MRIHFPRRSPPIVPAPHLDEGLVGALHDALRADIDPRARGHLPVHHEPLAIELVETVPGRPVRHEIGIGDQHARRVGMGAEHADRLARLDEQRLVALEAAQARDDAVERLPVARGAPDAAIDDELARPFGDVGIEIVHQHPHRRFGLPAFGGKLGSARAADDAHIVDAARRGHGADLSWLTCREDRFERAPDRRPRRRRARLVDGRRPVPGAGRSGSAHIGAAGELELHGLDSFPWPAIGARDPAAFEAPVDHHALTRRGENAADRLAQPGRTACAGIGPEIEQGQFALEQARDHGADGVGVEQRDAPMRSDGAARSRPRAPHDRDRSKGAGARRFRPRPAPGPRDRAARRRRSWPGRARSSPGRDRAKRRSDRD